MTFYISESFNAFSGKFSGYDFTSNNYYQPLTFPSPVLIGKDDVLYEPNKCCAKDFYTNNPCNSNGLFKKHLSDGKWYCGSHLWIGNRIFEYKRDYVRKKQLCSICHEDMYFDQKITQTMCSHKFHTECLDKWLEKKHNCPMCRHGLFDEDDPLVNHKLVHNHYILSKAMELDLIIGNDLLTYLNTKFNDSLMLQDQVSFLKTLNFSSLIGMFNKVSIAINENTLIRMTLYSTD